MAANCFSFLLWSLKYFVPFDLQVLDVSKEGKEEVFYGPTLPFASNGIAACFLPAPYFTCPNLQTLQVPHHRIGTVWDKEQALHKIRNGGGKKSQTLCIEGFLRISEKCQSTQAAALPSHICLKVRSQQAARKGATKTVRSFSPLPWMQKHLHESIWHFCRWLLATCLHVLMQLGKALRMLSAAGLLLFGGCTFSCSPVALSKLTGSSVYADKGDVILW